jgi:hypothetical protein
MINKFFTEVGCGEDLENAKTLEKSHICCD